MGLTIAGAPLAFGRKGGLRIRASSGAFTPSSIAGLQGWYDFSAVPAGAIASQADLSGNGRTLTQATGASQPVGVAAVQNGKNVCRLDGVDDFLIQTSGTTFLPKTLFVVAKYSAATFAAFNGLVTGTGAGNGDAFLIGNGAGTTVFLNINSPTYFKDGVSLAAGSMTGPMNAFAQMDVSSTVWNTVSFQIGKDRNQSGRYWGGDVCEVLSYDTVLAAGNLASVRAFLKAKWGTP